MCGNWLWRPLVGTVHLQKWACGWLCGTVEVLGKVRVIHTGDTHISNNRGSERFFPQPCWRWRAEKLSMQLWKTSWPPPVLLFFFFSSDTNRLQWVICVVARRADPWPMTVALLITKSKCFFFLSLSFVLFLWREMRRWKKISQHVDSVVCSLHEDVWIERCCSSASYPLPLTSLGRRGALRAGAGGYRKGGPAGFTGSVGGLSLVFARWHRAALGCQSLCFIPILDFSVAKKRKEDISRNIVE